MKDKLPLLEALINYHNENNILYSMPGNKVGKAFERDGIGKYFADNLGHMDITEVDPLDNLHHAEGVIKEAEESLAKLYNVKKAYFLVNGTTGGNLASIFAMFNEGDEVIVERNCHRSIYNALILRKLKVNYIAAGAYETSGIFYPPGKDNIYEAVNKYPNAKGIILTYPNYFGISYDIEETLKGLKHKGLKIIIDEAHGAHYGICDELPVNIAGVADITITSAHKTLPALTGGSFLLSNVEDSMVDFYVSAFMTTSPSYLIMASLDYARHYLESYGEEDYETLIAIAEDMKKKINSLGKVKILSKYDLPKDYEIDKSRYVVTLPKGYSGAKLQDYLRTNKIQCEMCFHEGVVLILSWYNAKESLETLYNVFKEMDINLFKDNAVNEISFNEVLPKKALEPFEVLNCKEEIIDINDAEDKVLKEAIVPYPPGIPVACPGEVVDKTIIELVCDYLKHDITVLGVENRKIKICK